MEGGDLVNSFGQLGKTAGSTSEWQEKGTDISFKVRKAGSFRQISRNEVERDGAGFH